MIRTWDVSEADPIPPITGKSASEASTMDEGGPRETPEPEGGTPESTIGHICDAWAELVGLGAQHQRGGNGHQGIDVGQSSWRQWILESIGHLWCGIRVGQDLGAQGSIIMRQEPFRPFSSGGWANSSAGFAVVDVLHCSAFQEAGFDEFQKWPWWFSRFQRQATGTASETVTAFPPLGAGPTSTIPEGTGFFSMMAVSLPSQTSTAPFDFPTGYLASPPNLASGSITTGCDWCYTVVSGDTCGKSPSNFDPINPCPKLTPGSAVCVLVTNATATIPLTPTNAAAGSAPSGCARWYTIVRGDGCAKLEMTFNLTQSELFALNLELTRTFCTGFGTALWSTIGFEPRELEQSGDSCNLIEAKFSISFSDFLHRNPEVSTTCGNLNLATLVSQDSCGAIETETSVSDAVLRSLNPWLDSIYKWDKTCPPANLNPGSWSNCSTYYNVQSGDNCNLIESKFSISFCGFLHWNPEVSTTCSNLDLAPITRALKSYCVGISDLQVGQNLCIKNSHVSPPPVGPPANLNPGSWSKYLALESRSIHDLWQSKPHIVLRPGSGACSKLYTVVGGDSCGAIEAKVPISDAQLHAENKWINSRCTNIQPGQNLCV
ncbi:hypothetical protein C8J57DRAFT_1472117 [Mycena rebaudengoi]|nr:hypothetical protein C8J57DRAFT_1472117 [Mycena rebaudengoi]